jgi:hypothetical protein
MPDGLPYTESAETSASIGRAPMGVAPALSRYTRFGAASVAFFFVKNNFM